MFIVFLLHLNIMALIQGNLDRKGRAFVEVTITPSLLYRMAIGLNKFSDARNHLGIAGNFQYKGLALIDTGATVSSIDVGVAKKIGLVSKGPVPVDTPKGNHDYDAFDIDLYISMQGKLSLLENKIVIASFLKAQGVDMLIGADIIRLGTLIFDRGATFKFSI